MWRKAIDKSTLKLLMAYLDGEFEANSALAEKKRAIEELIDGQPQLQDDIVAYRKLKQLWQQTQPTEPDEQAYDHVLAEIKQHCAERKSGNDHSRRHWPLWNWSILASAAAVLIAVGLLWKFASPELHPKPVKNVSEVSAPHSQPPGPKSQGKKEDADAVANLVGNEPLAVVAAQDIQILYVPGDDTGTIVAANLPVTGPLELAEPGEVTLTKIEPADEDNMIPNIHTDTEPPMIWAPVKRDAN